MLREKARRQRDFRGIVADGEIRPARRADRAAHRRAHRRRTARPCAPSENGSSHPQRPRRRASVMVCGPADLAVHHIASFACNGFVMPPMNIERAILKPAHQRRFAVVPLAADECRVTRACRTPAAMSRRGAVSVDVEQVRPGQQHRPRWHAGRGLEPALHVGAVERHAAVREPVEAGVLMTGLPRAAIVSARWSSAKRNRTLSFSAARLGPTASRTPVMVQARQTKRFMALPSDG